MLKRAALTLFFIGILGYGFVETARAEALIYLSGGPYNSFSFNDEGNHYSSDGGFGVSIGAWLLPPVLIIPGIDIGFDYDSFPGEGDLEGTFVTAQLSLGLPLIYGYFKKGFGSLSSHLINELGVPKSSTDSASKTTLGMSFGFWAVNVFYERVEFESIVDFSAHRFGVIGHF